MMRLVCRVLLVAFALPATAIAEPRVTAQDIIDHFTGRGTAPSGEPQRTRSVVVSDPAAPSDRSVHIGASGFGSGAEGSGAQAAAPPSGEEGGQQGGPPIPPTGANRPTGPAADPGAYDLLIEFDLDSAILRADARRHLDAFAEALRDRALADRRFLVEGHTDATGSDDYNLRLSRRRAAAVVDYLVAHGVDAGRLTARGFGETRPRVADPDNPANRRVETRLLD